MKKAILFVVLICGSLRLSAQVDSLRKDPPKVVCIVEQMPEFPGGDVALLKFIKDNLQYPSAEITARVEGRVIVGFMLYEDGSVHDVVIKKGVSAGLDQEAKRVVEMLPNFRPGRQQGKAVRVNFTLPIVFKIGDANLPSVVAKITPQIATTSTLSQAALSKWEEAFSVYFYQQIVKGNKQNVSIVIDFALNTKGTVTAFDIRSGGGIYESKRIKKSLSASLEGIKPMFPQELLGAIYGMSIEVR